MAHNPNQLIDTILDERYQILRDLGEESLGRVFVARDLGEGGRLVQVKVISPSIGADEETFARFGREISASFMVSHPNTVEVLDYGQQGELRYLVSEFLAAVPLAKALQDGVFSVERAAQIGAQVATAMAAAHQEGIVHRALSPDTVLLLENSRSGDYVKVADFGLSKLSDDEGDSDVTRADVRVGSPAYMAPEYIDEGVFDPKGDLYALGCLLFELASGQPPYVGDPSTILRLQVEGAPPRLSTRVDGVPEWFDTLIADLLSKEPSARPGTHQVAQRLEAGLGRTLQPPALWPLDADGQVQRPEAPEPGPPVARIAGIAAVVLLGVVALIMVLIASVATIVLLLNNLPS